MNFRISKHNIMLPQFFAVEVAVFIAVAYLCLYPLRLSVGLVEQEFNALIFCLQILTLIICLSLAGVYQTGVRDDPVGIVFRILVSLLVALAIFQLVGAAFNHNDKLEFGVLASLLGLLTLLTASIRAFFSYVVGEQPSKRQILVLGAGERALHFSNKFVARKDVGFSFANFIHVSSEKDEVRADKTIKMPVGLAKYALENGIDEIVVAVQDRRATLPVKELLECKLSGISVTDTVSFVERECCTVDFEQLNPSWLIYSDGFNHSGLRLFSVRLVGVVMSLLLVLITWPLMLIVAILIYLEDRGPVFYTQDRVGMNGKVFKVIKFRSMRTDAEKNGAKWAQKNDDRITYVGRVIRKLRIDELPQIVNVMRGEMGFIGPRPERPEFVAMLRKNIKYYDERHNILPGITGWAQLCHPYGASEEDSAEKLRYDLYYVKNHSLLLDLIILARTVEVVLFGKGAR